MSGSADEIDFACQQVVEVVTDYLEGQLDQEATSAVEHHLILCPGCDRYLDQMRQTIEVLGHVPVESLSPAARRELVAAFADFHRGATGPPA